MNAKISLVTIVIAVCLKVSASSAPDPELNRPIASDNAKPATLLPVLIWNPLGFPSGDSLYQTLLLAEYNAIMTIDLNPYIDSLAGYHLFIMAGIYEHGEWPTLREPDIRPFLPAILAFLVGGGAAYWEGASAFADIDAHSGDTLFDYFHGIIWANPSPLNWLSGQGSTIFSDIDSLQYSAGGAWTSPIESDWRPEANVLEAQSSPKGIVFQVGQTRTMLTNFSWARLNDSGTNSRVDLIDDVMEWLSGAVAVEEPEPLPQAFSLSPPYPNPFNTQTTIEYALPNEAAVSLSIFDIQGRKVATLTEGTKPAGYHRLIWDAKGMPSGMYFVRLKAGEFTETQKMTLVK